MASITKKRICFITGTRAEYGLLYPLMKEVANDKQFVPQLIVTGSHLSKDFGATIDEIKKDGFVIDHKIDILSNSDDAKGISNAMGKVFSLLPAVLEKLSPSLIVVLGDRYEIFSVVGVANIMQIPIAHIHGGELTMGAIDDAFRHSITKMSHLHFASTEEYKKRIIQLGEDPKYVFNVGAMALDNIKLQKLYDKKRLENELGIKFRKKNIIVTFHPETISKRSSTGDFDELLGSLHKLKDTFVIFTYPNADAEGRALIKMIDRYVTEHPRQSVKFNSLGRLKYLSILQFVDAVVGNSSSGIIEGPLMKVATVNIGDRQKGRLRTASIIDCEPIEKEISKAIFKIYSSGFQTKLSNLKNPYGKGEASRNIKKVFSVTDFSVLLKKRFHDI